MRGFAERFRSEGNGEVPEFDFEEPEGDYLTASKGAPAPGSKEAVEDLMREATKVGLDEDKAAEIAAEFVGAPSEAAASPEPPAAPEVSEDQLMSDFQVTHGVA